MALPSECATVLVDDGKSDVDLRDESYATICSSLASDDAQFIRLAELIILRLKKVRRDKYPSWFDRRFKNSRIGRRRRMKRKKKEEETDYGYLSSDDLIDFQTALFLRLEEQEKDPTVFIFADVIDLCLIRNYMNSVLQLVELVGWPKPDNLELIFPTENSDRGFDTSSDLGSRSNIE